MDKATLFSCLLIFSARVCDVSLGTLRVLMVTQGRRTVAACLGFVEVLIWVAAVSRVIGNGRRVSKARLIITAVVLEGRSQAQVARDYDVSPAWVSRLVARYRSKGDTAFEPRSKRPGTRPRQTPAATVEVVVNLRRSLTHQGLDAGPVEDDNGVGDITGDIIEPALNLTAKGGTCVVTAIGDMMQTDAQLNLFMFSMMNKELKGCLFGSGNPRFDIPNLLSMYREGQLKLDEMVTRRYTLDQINEGYADMKSGKNIRGIIEFD